MCPSSVLIKKRIEGGQDGIEYISNGGRSIVIDGDIVCSREWTNIGALCARGTPRYWQIIGRSGRNGREWNMEFGARIAEIGSDRWDIGDGEGRVRKKK
jgi:hypothetical protein